VDINTKSLRSLAQKPIDTVIVPGAFRVEDVTRDRVLMQWLRKIAPRVQARVLDVQWSFPIGCRRDCR
jgi:transcriptional regulator GlxA family with amidase domain